MSFGRVLVMMGAGLAPVQGNADPGIMLSCLPQTAEVAELCGVMRDVIAAARPGETVLLGDAEADQDTKTAVRLHVERMKRDALAVHLEWRQPGQEWQRGDTRALTVMDRDLNVRMITRFFEALWVASPVAR